MIGPPQIIIVPEDPGPDTLKADVLRVFDGDGFLAKVSASELTRNPSDESALEVAVRCGFIDAPELEQPGGREAKDFLTGLIGGKSVDLVVLTKMDTGSSVDSHGRIVCVPFLTLGYTAGEFKTSSNETHTAKPFAEPLFVARNIELEMVINGWAWVLDRYEPDERYSEALSEAKRNKRGIWAFDNNIHPWEFKKQKHIEARRTSKDPAAPHHSCPNLGCDGLLVRRTGRFGEFFGCTNFPRCKYSCSALP